MDVRCGNGNEGFNSVAIKVVVHLILILRQLLPYSLVSTHGGIKLPLHLRVAVKFREPCLVGTLLCRARALVLQTVHHRVIKPRLQTRDR